MNNKIKSIFAIIVIFMFTLMPIGFALDFVYVNVDTTKTTAEFEWKTNDATKYTLEYQKQGSGTEYSISGTQYLVTNIETLTNLDDDTYYDYTISATNAVGTPKEYSGTFKTKDGTAPGIVQDLYSPEQTDSTISIQWNAPIDSDLSHYTIFLDGVFYTNTTQTEYELTDLMPSTDYTIGVSSVDTSGNIAPAVEITKKTDIPEYPAIFDISVSTYGLTATISWNTFREGDSQIDYGTSETLGTTIKESTSTFEHEIMLENLESNTTYYYKLTSCNDEGCGETQIKEFKIPVYKPVFIELKEYSKNVNTHELALQGNTTSDSKIIAYTGNNINAQTTANSDGKFTIYLRLQEGENKIRLVAEDFVGITTETQITLYSDTTPPELIVGEIPEVVTEKNSILTITPSEYVDLKIYVIPEIYNVDPLVVQNVVAQNEGDNVLISWDELKNDDGTPVERIKEFVILRDGNYVGTVEGSRTTFTDTMVGPSKEYSYTIFAVSNYCRFGGTSTSARVITSNSIDNNEGLPEKGYSCEKVPDKEQKTGGMIQFNFRTFIQEGMNTILIEASDEAGNTLEEEYDFYYDSEDPRITETNLDDITPTFSQVVTIRGKVSEEATVYAILNNQTTDKKEYSTTTDEEGNFEIQISVSQSELVQVDEEGNKIYTEIDFGNFQIENEVILYAIDNAGRRSQDITENILYQPCGGEQIILNAQEFWPTDLTPRDLVKNNAQLTLYYTIEESIWNFGTETLDNPTVGIPRVYAPPQFGQELIEQYNYDWIKGGTYSRMSTSRDALVIYMNFGVPQEVKDLISEDLGKDWNDLTEFEKEEAIYEQQPSIKILFTVEIPYSTIGADGKTEVKNHLQCKEINVPIDKPISAGALISSKIERINSYLTTLSNILEGMNKISNFLRQVTTVGCYGSYIGYGVKWITTAVTCGTNLPFVLAEGADATCGESNNNDKCNACKDAVVSLNQYKVQWLQNTCHRVSCEEVPSLKAYVNSKRYDASHACFGLSYEEVLSVLDTQLNGGGKTAELKKKLSEELLKSDNNGYERWLYKVGDDKSCLLAYHDYYSTAMGIDANGQSADILVLNYCNEYPTKCGEKDWVFTSKSSLCEQINEKVNGYQIELIPRDEDGKSIAKEFLTHENGDPIRILVTIDGTRATVMFGTVNKEGIVTNKLTDQGNIIIDNTHYYDPMVSIPVDYTAENYGGFNEGTLKTALTKEFGGNNIQGLEKLDFTKTFEDQIGKEERTIIFDPQSNILNSFTSACLSGVESYSAQYLNVIGTVQSCLASVAYSGAGDSQACQELFSVYVCDAISSVVKCGVDIALPKQRTVLGLDPENTKDIVKGGIDQWKFALSQAIKEGSRFGTVADLQDVISMKSVTTGMCLWFFGIDKVDISSIWSDLVTTEDTVAIAPTIQPIRAQRRFITFDPTTGYAKYEYSAIVLASATTDARVQLELVCSDALGCGIDECDCTYGGEESVILGSMTLKDGDSNVTSVYKSIQGKKRYDRLRITYKWKNSEGTFVTGDIQEVNLINQGEMPAYCELDALSLEFKCQTGFISQGYAYLVEPIYTNYYNDKIRVSGTIVNNYQTAESYDPSGIVFVRTEVVGDSTGQGFAVSDPIYPQPQTGFSLDLDISHLLSTSKTVSTKISDTTYVKSVTLDIGVTGDLTEDQRKTAIDSCGLYGEWTLKTTEYDHTETTSFIKEGKIIPIMDNIGNLVCPDGSQNKIVVVLNSIPLSEQKITVSEIPTATTKTFTIKTTLYHSDGVGYAPDLTRPVEQQGVQPTMIQQTVDITK